MRGLRRASRFRTQDQYFQSLISLLSVVVLSGGCARHSRHRLSVTLRKYCIPHVACKKCPHGSATTLFIFPSTESNASKQMGHVRCCGDATVGISLHLNIFLLPALYKLMQRSLSEILRYKNVSMYRHTSSCSLVTRGLSSRTIRRLPCRSLRRNPFAISSRTMTSFV